MTVSDSRNIPVQGAGAQFGDRRVLVGNLRLMTAEQVELGPLAQRREELAAEGRTAVLVTVDGRAVGVIPLADALRQTGGHGGRRCQRCPRAGRR